MDEWFQKQRERVMAEIRVARLERQIEVAHLDWLGLLLRDNEISPWGARAALADLQGGGQDAQDQ